MFIALDANNERVSLLHYSEYDIVSCYSPPFYCPSCRQPLILKKGTVRRWHFAHQELSSCPSQTEPETAEHLAGKAKLYSWLKQQGLSPVVEAAIPSINRTADVLVSVHSQTYAFEFQCASIPLEEMRQRTNDYLSLNIYPVWLFSANRIRPRKQGYFSIRAFEWTALQERLHDYRHALLYFSPISSTFSFLFPRIVLSPSRIFADFYSLPASQTTFNMITDLPLTMDGTSPWKPEWLRLKKEWRFGLNKWQNERDRAYVRQIFAKQRSDLPFFPAEAGWPSLFMEYFKSPAYIWQSWLLLVVIQPLQLGQTFLLTDILPVIQPLITKGIFPIRELPLVKEPLSKALTQYLYVLAFFGVVEKSDSGCWSKIRNIELPLSLEQGFYLDKKCVKCIM